VIGGGDGGVLREIRKHASVKEIVLCEIDELVIQTAKTYLPFMAQGFNDPRLKVHIGDGSKYLDDHENVFDIIICDSSDPLGPASSLFGKAFYKSMFKSLRAGGIICTQAECIWLHLDLIQDIMLSASDTFKSVEYACCGVPTYPSGQIGFIIGGKDRESCKRPLRTPSYDQQNEMRYYTPDIHAASFILPAFAERRLSTKK
jgi:spermidine synthase